MSKRQFKNPEVFATANTALASALVTAGVPFAEPLHPFVNIYTEERLAELGVESVAEAMKRRLPGKITYHFSATPGLKKLLKAFGDTSELIRMAAEGAEIAPPDLDVSPEEVMRISCQFAANRSWFAENWFKPEPIVKIMTGEKSFVLVSRNASKATKERLGIA